MEPDARKASFGALVLAAAFAPRCGGGEEEGEQDEEPELVRGLSDWLTEVRLFQYIDQAEAWCNTRGFTDVSEVRGAWAEFADSLALKPLERKRLEKDISGEDKANVREGLEKYVPKPQKPARAKPAPAAAAAVAQGPTAQVQEAQPPPQPQPPGQPSLAPLRSLSAGGTFGPPEDPNRYEIVARIGAGATAQVYKCTRKGQTFAAKSIGLAKLRHQPNYTQILDMLHQEVAILLSLQHPRIVMLHDVVEDQTSLRLVMELVEGGALDEYIGSKGPLPEPEASYIFAQLAEGLEYIHTRGFVHRDLKPENVLLDAKASRPGLPEVKLTDFGHSQVVGDWYSTSPRRAGTPLYCAPEVAAGWEVEPGQEGSADLWSLGVVLYTMLVGCCPFGGEQLEQEIQRGNFSFYSEHPGPPPSKDAQNLVRSLIRVDPRKRLSLDWCLAHPFVAGSGGLLRQILKISGWSEPRPVEDKYQLLPWMTHDQACLLRHDLQRWMVKFRYAAIMTGREVVIHWGDEGTLDLAKVQAARAELAALAAHHLGARGPSGGNAARVLPALVAAARCAAAAAAEASSPGGRSAASGADSGEESPVSESEARQRRLEARKRKEEGGGSRWNFGGRPVAAAAAQQVDDRFREHEADLERRRRLAFRGRGEFRTSAEDTCEQNQRPPRG